MKESDDTWWGLPGGGVDHGETVEQGLRRELREELGVKASKVAAQPVFVWVFDGRYVHEITSHYMLWLVYEVQLATEPPGVHDGNQAKYFDKTELKPTDLAEYFAPAYDELVQYHKN